LVDYIKTQLVNDVNKEFLFAESLTADQVFLQATEDTARTASQGEPEYRVMLVRDGSIQPLYGFSWKPDQQKQINKVEAENEKVLLERRTEGTRQSVADFTDDVLKRITDRREKQAQQRASRSGQVKPGDPQLTEALDKINKRRESQDQERAAPKGKDATKEIKAEIKKEVQGNKLSDESNITRQEARMLGLLEKGFTKIQIQKEIGKLGLLEQEQERLIEVLNRVS